MKSGSDCFRFLCSSIGKIYIRITVNWDRLLCWLLSFLMTLGFVWYCLRYTIPEEAMVRQSVASAAKAHMGTNEMDGSHHHMIDRYNQQPQLPRGYIVTYEDSWCAVFGSVIALDQNLTDIIPLECSCEQQISLFSSNGCWIEKDYYFPKPGDYIFYDWNYSTKKDSKGWSDHVGIVTKTVGPVIQVIEGNKDDSVSYRYVFINDPTIQGFGVPDYGSIAFDKR